MLFVKKVAEWVVCKPTDVSWVLSAYRKLDAQSAHFIVHSHTFSGGRHNLITAFGGMFGSSAPAESFEEAVTEDFVLPWEAKTQPDFRIARAGGRRAARPASPDSKLVTVSQIARLLGVSDTWVYRRTADGRIPCMKRDGVIRFDPDEVMRWFKSQNEGAKR